MKHVHLPVNHGTHQSKWDDSESKEYKKLACTTKSALTLSTLSE